MLGVIKTIEMFQSTQVDGFLQSDSSLGVGYLYHTFIEAFNHSSSTSR